MYSTNINYLPVELLLHIFNLATHSAPRFSPDSITTPLILLAVNRHWRQLALLSPTLWTSLSISAADVEHSNINLHHISTYIYLSRNAPLDILIDARDPDWNFTESEIPYSLDPCDYYRHPFSSAHMHASLDVLLHHLHRWRSLTILTDTYAPMYAALTRLHAIRPTRPLPLESLTLMRCNEFVAHSFEFTPRELNHTPFLPFSACLPRDTEGDMTDPGVNILPRLSELTLSGVHFDWSSLPHILPRPRAADRSDSHCGLQSLELSYHPSEVRPDEDQFRAIFDACPGLKQLAIKVSGLCIDPDNPMPPADTADKVPLLHLSDLTLCYTDAEETRRFLDILHAPNVKRLTLEDGSHPADPSEEDASSLLRYCGTGIGGEHQQGDKLRNDDCHDHPPFRLVEDLALHGVRACPDPYTDLYDNLPNLQRLSLAKVPIQAITSLTPHSSSSSTAVPNTTVCPCPRLTYARIRDMDLSMCYNVYALIAERERCGVRALREVALHVPCCAAETCEEVQLVHGTRLRFVLEGQWRGEFEGEGEEMDVEGDGEDDPFVEGGAFNDPEFDAYYGSSVLRS